MIAIQFLAEWALRSAILIISGAVLLRALRVKDSSVRLAAWSAMLFGSPCDSGAHRGAAAFAADSCARERSPRGCRKSDLETPLKSPSTQDASAVKRSPALPRPFDWPSAALAIYMLVAAALLLRLCLGLAMSRRLLRDSRAAGKAIERSEIRESSRVAAPVTLGILQPGDFASRRLAPVERGKAGRRAGA